MWSEHRSNAFNEMIKILSKAPVLISPSDKCDFIIEKVGITKNRHYWFGKKYTILTDCRILLCLHDKREHKNKKLLNWALTLSE